MTWSVDSSSCSSITTRKKPAGSLDSSWSSYYGEAGELDYPDKKSLAKPLLVAVYNGKVLDISAELLGCGLSGISIKHYDGDCLPPRGEESEKSEELPGESEYYFPYEEDFGESPSIAAEEARSPSMASLIKLCYEPKRRGTSMDSGNAAEESGDYSLRPPCVQDGVNFRNSFWDLHRPELCKLTWPHVYVGAATVTKHLHKHLLHHGPICAAFHEDQDMNMMLDRELDIYDRLMVVMSPREIPPDDDRGWGTRRRRRRKPTHPCKPRPKIDTRLDWSDDSDLSRYQCLHISKEEFCITIGRPERPPPLREEESLEDEGRQLWLPGEYETEYDYHYGEAWVRPNLYMYTGEEDEGGTLSDESVCESSSTPSEPGWVEPDYCAML